MSESETPEVEFKEITVEGFGKLRLTELSVGQMMLLSGGGPAPSFTAKGMAASVFKVDENGQQGETLFPSAQLVDSIAYWRVKKIIEGVNELNRFDVKDAEKNSEDSPSSP